MSVLAFILGLVQALAWPVFALLVALVFRYPISNLVRQVAITANRMRARAGPVEFEIERVLDESVQEIKQEVSLKAAVPSSPVIRPPMAFRLNAVLTKDPNAAIDQGYKEVESLLKTLLINAGAEVSAIADLPVLARLASDRKLVISQFVQVADAIATARDKLNRSSVNGGEAYAFMSMYDIAQYVVEAYRVSPSA
jgi:hypothetical protein